MSSTLRIAIFGKTGTGKSSLANTIFGEEVFKIDHTLHSETSNCLTAKTKSLNGRSITVVDTPGSFSVDRPKEELECEIAGCTSECAPGPHAIFIVLKVEKFTAQEQAAIAEMLRYFSEEALKYAAVVFTHGDQLPDGMKIEEFVNKNKCLRDLVKKCNGRCHVMDNKYWKGYCQGGYRSNAFQVAELLNTTDHIVKKNKGSCFSKEQGGGRSKTLIRNVTAVVGGFIVGLFRIFVWAIFGLCEMERGAAAAGVVAVEVLSGFAWVFMAVAAGVGKVVSLAALAALVAVVCAVCAAAKAFVTAVGGSATAVVAALTLGVLVAGGASGELIKLIRSLFWIWSVIAALLGGRGRGQRWLELHMRSFRACFERRKGTMLLIVILFYLLLLHSIKIWNLFLLLVGFYFYFLEIISGIATFISSGQIGNIGERGGV